MSEEIIKDATWAEVPTPTLLLTEKSKQKDGDKRKQAKAKTKDDASMRDTDRTDQLKGSQGEEKGETKTDTDDPVANVTAEGEGVLFLLSGESSSECCGCLGGEVDRTDHGAAEPATDNAVDKKTE